MTTRFVDVLRRAPDGGWKLLNATTGVVLASVTETAFTRRQRRRGLLGRETLGDGHALVLAPCSAIHTWFMRFPIDVLFVAGDGRVLKVCPAVLPWRLRLRWGADATIEVPVGSIGATGTSVGHRLEVVSPAAE